MELTEIDLIDLALSYAKEFEMKKSLEKLKKAELDLMKQDATSRRKKSAALIDYIRTIDVEILKLKLCFAKYSADCSEDERMVYDRVVKMYELKRKKIVTEKQRLS